MCRRARRVRRTMERQTTDGREIWPKRSWPETTADESGYGYLKDRWPANRRSGCWLGGEASLSLRFPGACDFRAGRRLPPHSLPPADESEANSSFRINKAFLKMTKNEAKRTQPNPKANEATPLESSSPWLACLPEAKPNPTEATEANPSPARRRRKSTGPSAVSGAKPAAAGC